MSKSVFFSVIFSIALKSKKCANHFSRETAKASTGTQSTAPNFNNSVISLENAEY